MKWEYNLIYRTGRTPTHSKEVGDQCYVKGKTGCCIGLVREKVVSDVVNLMHCINDLHNIKE